MNIFTTVVCWFILVTFTECANCPIGSFGKYPDCTCSYAEYDTKMNKCINHECPELSEGTYPNCWCHENHSYYNSTVNDCAYYCPPECIYYWPNSYCKGLVRQSSGRNSTIVQTNYGLVEGILIVSLLGDSYHRFQGIPYARPPLGELRFRDPQPLEPWVGIFDATTEKPPCWQVDEFSNEIVGTEDCLRLNIYTRNVKVTKLAPVMVFIHGGAFMYGSGNTDLYGPDFLMQKNAVVVTFNYRLGAFGFLSINNERYRIPGNAGLKDQTQALVWIKENIVRFGGDPNNILLFGQSAGGNAVSRHMISPLSRNLFHKAIVMSGSDLTTRFELAEHATKDFYTKRHATLVGWDGTGGLSNAVKTLRGADPLLIVQTQINLLTTEDKLKGIRYPYGPVLECSHSRDVFLSTEPRVSHLNSWSKKIPVILGSTSEEALVYYRSASVLGSDLLRSINFEYKIPRDTGRTLTASETANVSRKIKEFYFKNELASRDILLRDFIRMETDRQYVHGMCRTALARLYENGNERNPTYYYRFNWDSQNLNHHRKIEYCGTNCQGVSHAEDLSFLFRSQYVKSVDNISPEDFEKIQWMVDIFYKFAQTGNPNIGVGDQWASLNKNDVVNGHFACLNIANELKLINLPESAAVHF